MASKVSNTSILFVFMSIILFTNIPSILAFNITFFLNQHPEFSTFNHLLTETGVANGINKQNTVSVLVVHNSAAAPLSREPQSTIRNVLATHVILDFYDKYKLDNLEGKSAKAANLFQKTGKANGGQGFVNISNSGGQIVFASAENGAPQDSKLVKVVASQPYHISVIQIRTPLVTPGLDQAASGPASPSGSPDAESPNTDPTFAPPGEATGTAPAPGPSGEGEAADGPTSDSESPTEASGPAPGEASEGDEADKNAPADKEPKDKNSSGARLNIGGGVVAALTGLVALLAH